MLVEAFDARRTRVIRVQEPEPTVVERPPRVLDDPVRVQARRDSIEQARAAVDAERAERERLWSMVRDGAGG